MIPAEHGQWLTESSGSCDFQHISGEYHIGKGFIDDISNI